MAATSVRNQSGGISMPLALLSLMTSLVTAFVVLSDTKPTHAVERPVVRRDTARFVKKRYKQRLCVAGQCVETTRIVRVRQ